MLSITDGGPDEAACATDENNARDTDPLFDRIRLEAIRSMLAILWKGYSLMRCRGQLEVLS